MILVQSLIGRKTQTITVPLGIVIVLHIKKVKRQGKVQTFSFFFFTYILWYLQEYLSAAQLTSVIDYKKDRFIRLMDLF